MSHTHAYPHPKPRFAGLRNGLASLCALLVCAVALAQTTLLEVIPLRYRTAEQVIPIIEPMLAPGGSISGMRGQLIVRTTPANLQEIRRVLASVDAMPRRLLITVRFEGEADSSRRAAEISGSVGNDHARVIVPGSGDRGGNVVLRDGDDRLRARVFDSRRSESDSNTHSVQVLEGSTAFIRSGQSLPVPSRQVVRSVVNGRVVEQVVDGTEYRDLGSGFHVLPRLSGDRVTLDINPQRETPSRQIPGAVNVQGMATTVSGRLGEWMEIGGVSQQRSSEQATLLGRGSGSVAQSRRVLVKVEELRGE